MLINKYMVLVPWLHEFFAWSTCEGHYHYQYCFHFANQEKLNQEIQKGKVSISAVLTLILFDQQVLFTWTVFYSVPFLDFNPLTSYSFFFFQDCQAVLASVQKDIQRLEMELDSNNREKVKWCHLAAV